MDIPKADKGPGIEAQARADDPVLGLRGVGSQLWEHESGDRFVDRLRSGDPPPIGWRAPEAAAKSDPKRR